MEAYERCLQELFHSLPPGSVDKQVLDSLITTTLSNVGHLSSSESNRKAMWEFVLRNEVFNLAASEGKALKEPQTPYYGNLRDRLDIILAFTERDVCEQIFLFHLLYDLLETQTIASCSHIFSWIEERADRLMEGMVPQKGKALVLLRTLNELLKRLSKMGSTTMFCGRILTFLSRVFPLGERSGVNLRGEYGPVWEGPGIKSEDTKDEDGMKVEKLEESQPVEGEKMQVDGENSASSKLESSQAEDDTDFYRTFWSLQLPFSRPPLFSEPRTLPQFKEAVNKVLPVIKEATAKERALMGSKTSASGPHGPLKRKRETEIVEITGKEYFFAKYLTSPDLLELEIADTHFRRQFLFQLLVLLHHLLSFTKTAKTEWATSRNRSLQIDFTLDPTDAQWVQDTIDRANEELRQTSPNGRAFAETVNTILEREKNWTRWKNELCSPFDKEPWSEEVEIDEGGSKVKRKLGMEEATRSARVKLGESPPLWKHKLGSAPLTEIWEMGYRDLADLQRPLLLGDVKDFVKKVQQEDQRITLRKNQLTKKAEQMAAARTKAAAQAAAASQPKEAASPPKPIAPSSAPQESTSSVSTPTTAARVIPPATPPLHHPLPAKPGTTPVKPTAPLSQESAPAPVAIPTPAPTTPAPAPAPVPTIPVPEPVPVIIPLDDPIIRAAEESRQRLSWLALRTARDQYLQQFTKIGTGDIVILAQEIEKAKEVKENDEKNFAKGDDETIPPSSQDERGMSPVATSTSVVSIGDLKAEESRDSLASGRDGEGDVRMEA